VLDDLYRVTVEAQSVREPERLSAHPCGTVTFIWSPNVELARELRSRGVEAHHVEDPVEDSRAAAG
jgi:hypothetical protein